MPKIHLTDRGVQTLPVGLHFDTRTPGFGVRVGKHRKTWIVVKGERRTKTAIGRYPATSLADARKSAMVALASQMEAKRAPAFLVARAEYLAAGKWRPRSRIAIESSLRHFIWTKTIDKVSYQDVQEALSKILAKSARAHALKDIRAFFNWTVPRYLNHSPCAGIRMEAQPARTRVLSDVELRSIWGAATGQYGAIIKLLMLTGQRRGEIAALQMGWIFDDRVELPGTITKNGRDHRFPLGEVASTLIATAIGTRQFNDWHRCKTRLDQSSGIVGWTLHDLRRTVATNLAAMAVPIHVTEKLLNHVSGSTGGIVGVYQRHDYWTDQVEALEAWEHRLTALCDTDDEQHSFDFG